jgi:excisionase family DNA binding protein
MNGEWLSLSEAAEILGVHPSTVRSWANDGRIPVHLTQGGHRRFLRNEVELCMELMQPDRIDSIDEVIQNTLLRTRVQITEGRLQEESWYQKLDDDARNQYRRSSRFLLQGLIASVTAERADADAEARSLGYEYATRGRRCGLTCSEAAHAFLFFRGLLFESMYSVYEKASGHSPHVWGEMFKKITGFTDQILLHLLETFESFRGSNS